VGSVEGAVRGLGVAFDEAFALALGWAAFVADFEGLRVAGIGVMITRGNCLSIEMN
jgi:hypothetical protein